MRARIQKAHQALKTTSMSQALAIVILGGLSFFNVGCGSQGYTEQSSLSSETTPPAEENPTNIAYAYCSREMNGDGSLSARVMAVTNASGTIIPSRVRLALPRVPSVDWENNNYDLEVYRWTVSPSGDALPIERSQDLLRFQFERKSNNSFQLIANESYLRFNWEEMELMSAYAQQAAANPQDYFNKFSLLVDLKDSVGNYKVLRVVIRQASSGNTLGAVVKEIDVLLPVFEANPNEYNKTRPGVLQALHPLQTLASGGWTELQYKGFAEQNCF